MTSKPTSAPAQAASGARKDAEPAGVKTGLRSVPITLERPAPTDFNGIKHPELPRADAAISTDKPEGSKTYYDPNLTPMQNHVKFWDRDNDGIIWPIDTYVGFRRLGYNFIISFLAIFFIHGSFSYVTGSSWIPDLRFPIYTARLYKGKHGSDSGVFDTEGRFEPQKFEALFSKFDKENKGGLNWYDVNKLVWANSVLADPVGWTAERLEWFIFWLGFHDSRGLLTKEKIRAQYDGSLWYLCAEENERAGRHTGHDPIERKLQ